MCEYVYLRVLCGLFVRLDEDTSARLSRGSFYVWWGTGGAGSVEDNELQCLFIQT